MFIILAHSSPLVCVAIVTGASFFVFSGALKASSGFLAKTSIVEGTTSTSAVNMGHCGV